MIGVNLRITSSNVGIHNLNRQNKEHVARVDETMHTVQQQQEAVTYVAETV